MLFYAAVTLMKGRLAGFAKDDRASVSVDFVVAIPILLAVLVFTSEYGRVLQMRTVLDNAVSDATRYLARAPRGENCAYPPEVTDIAKQLISQRINVNHIAIGNPDCSAPPTAANIDDYQAVSLTVSIGVETPAISVISLIAYGEKDPKIVVEESSEGSGDGYEIAYRDIEGFVLTATETARYFGQ